MAVYSGEALSAWSWTDDVPSCSELDLVVMAVGLWLTVQHFPSSVLKQKQIHASAARNKPNL